jgi:hypothetical protein
MLDLCDCRGISNFARSDGYERTKVAAKLSSPWFWLICEAKTLCGKEAFLRKALWLLCGYKVTGPPAAKSGSAIGIFALYSIEIASFLAMTSWEAMSILSLFLFLKLHLNRNLFRLAVVIANP